jgi:hypothetical protein
MVVLLLAMLVLGAAPNKKKTTPPPPPAPTAPDVVPHSMALFLKSLCKDGTRQVTFRANAVGTRFFIEEPTGVTVYRFDKGQYVKDEFMRGAKLAAALKKYPAR